jgi:hypothetical protein
VAFCGELRTPGAVKSFDLEVAVVERIRKVRRRAMRFTRCDPVLVDDDDGAAFEREHVGDAEPGDAGAYDADVRAGIGLERRRA